jgi:hypothetical protein
LSQVRVLLGEPLGFPTHRQNLIAAASRTSAMNHDGEAAFDGGQAGKVNRMNKTLVAIATAFALSGLAACESQADKKAETQADALESQAAATPNEAQEKALNEKADVVEQQAGNADGGATTENTPTTDATAPATK